HLPPLASHSFPTRRSSDLHAGLGGTRPQVVAHLRAHLADLLAQRLHVALPAEHFGTNPLEIIRQLRTAHQHPRTHQRLMLPGPRSEEHTSELQSRENLVCR